MSKVIRLTAEKAPKVPEHALLDVVTLNLTTRKVQVRGNVGYYVDGPEGGTVLVPIKPRDDEFDFDAEVDAFVESMLARAAGRDKFKGATERAPDASAPAEE